MIGREQIILEEMLEHVQAIIEYASDMAREAFLKDRKTQDAVFMRFIALADCAGRLKQANSSLFDSVPDFPWRELIGMRNRLAHEYGFINPKLVWAAIEDTPKLANVIERLIASLRGERSEP